MARTVNVRRFACSSGDRFARPSATRPALMAWAHARLYGSKVCVFARISKIGRALASDSRASGSRPAIGATGRSRSGGSLARADPRRCQSLPGLDSPGSRAPTGSASRPRPTDREGRGRGRARGHKTPRGAGHHQVGVVTGDLLGDSLRLAERGQRVIVAAGKSVVGPADGVIGARQGPLVVEDIGGALGSTVRRARAIVVAPAMPRPYGRLPVSSCRYFEEHRPGDSGNRRRRGVPLRAARRCPVPAHSSAARRRSARRRIAARTRPRSRCQLLLVLGDVGVLSDDFLP